MDASEAARIMASMGGRARMARLTPEQRSEHARMMIAARWRKYRENRHIIGGESETPRTK